MPRLPAKSPPKLAQSSAPPARILAVDDDEGVLFTYRQLLTRAGYRVQTAASGEDGLRRLEQEQFDLVLLDLNMPGMEGVEFLRRIRRLKRRPEVLVISGFVTTLATVEVMKLGAFDVAHKPCLSGELLPRVERMVARLREPVVAYIRANFATIRSREEVAQHCHTCPETVSNRIRHYTGQSFHDFLESCRIQEARRLLTETEVEATEISDRIGFQCYKTFERAFQRLTGLTPSQYRKQTRPVRE
jgi:YesN/AraC family two-component response regulator